MCSVISCQKCPFSDKCYFSLSHKLIEKMKLKKESGKGKILVVNALKRDCQSLFEELSEIGNEFGLKVVSIDYNTFINELEEQLHKIAGEKYSIILLLIDDEDHFKALIYPIIELEEMGVNLLVVLPKRIQKKVERFKLNVIGVNETCSELGKIIGEVKRMIKLPVKNIYLVEYPKPIEKALSEGLILVIDLPLQASRRWILLKYFSGNKFVRDKISHSLNEDAKRKLRDITMKLWCDLGISPAYEINKAKERLIDEIKNSINDQQ